MDALTPVTMVVFDDNQPEKWALWGTTCKEIQEKVHKQVPPPVGDLGHYAEYRCVIVTNPPEEVEALKSEEACGIVGILVDALQPSVNKAKADTILFRIGKLCAKLRQAPADSALYRRLGFHVILACNPNDDSYLVFQASVSEKVAEHLKEVVMPVPVTDMVACTTHVRLLTYQMAIKRWLDA